MTKPRDTIHINVEYNTEDEAYGPVYIATNDVLSLVTDGRTFEELLENVREAVAVCLADTDAVAEFNLAPDAHIVLTMTLPNPDAQLA